MANDLAARAREAEQHFIDRIATSHSAWNRFVPVLTDQADATSRKITDLSGVAAYSAQAAGGAAPSAGAMDTSGTAYTDAAYEGRTDVTLHELRKNPGLLNEIAVKHANAAVAKLNASVWAALASLDTTAHPDSSVTGAGASPYIADVFSAPVSQATLKTTALGASALSAAIAELAAHTDKDGIYMGCADRPLYLVVPPELRQTALQLASRGGEIYDGTGLQDGGWPGLDASRVVVNPDTTDANDWGLYAEGFSPLELWLTAPPSIRVTPSEDSGRVIVYGEIAFGVVYAPRIHGFVFSKVA